MSKKIGVLGSGDVAKILAKGFLKHGYKVKMGTREVSKLDAFVKELGSELTVGSFEDAANFADIIVLAVKGKVARDVLKLAGQNKLSGKIIIDPTNPIEDAPPTNGVLKFFTNLDLSLMEQLQSFIPGAKFVKAFNMIGGPFMVNPNFGNSKPTMFICGNDASAKNEVTQILEKFGFETEDMGMVESARAIEPLCMLWCIPGLSQNKWNHAFKLLKN